MPGSYFSEMKNKSWRFTTSCWNTVLLLAKSEKKKNEILGSNQFHFNASPEESVGMKTFIIQYFFFLLILPLVLKQSPSGPRPFVVVISLGVYRMLTRYGLYTYTSVLGLLADFPIVVRTSVYASLSRRTDEELLSYFTKDDGAKRGRGWIQLAVSFAFHKKYYFCL